MMQTRNPDSPDPLSSDLLGDTRIFKFHYNAPGSERGGDGKGLLVEIHFLLVNTNDATLCQIGIQCGVVVYTYSKI